MRKQQTRVTVLQVSSVDLTRRGARNSLTIEVRSGEELLGKLNMGQGSVQWWPKGARTRDFERSWKEFARLLGTAIAG